ncbi:tetratricopeptide repeat protein [Aequorivita antarctica]|uniref:Tetratricopeptide repeat protein n=1 Tax=Aequorivita antarctica TaxID=153266 RepID=A0A5C6YVT3_9FLAO|nr:hypothetical protein [Aequorivita antarctica]TXD71260.1 hypothetical protein ESU54_17450 [Aequorivita antarctica]
MKNILLIIILTLISCKDHNVQTDVNNNQYVDNLNNGYAELQAHNFTQAIKYFNDIIDNLTFSQSETLVAKSYLYRGLAKNDLGDERGAISDFTMIINNSRVNDYIAEAYHFRGIAHLNMRNLDLACSDWSKSGELGINRSYKFIQENCN